MLGAVVSPVELESPTDALSGYYFYVRSSFTCACRADCPARRQPARRLNAVRLQPVVLPRNAVQRQNAVALQGAAQQRNAALPQNAVGVVA